MPALLPSLRGLPRSYWFLWAGALVNRIGYFVAPFLAIYLTESLHLSVARAGAVVSCYGLGVLVASPLGGHLADAIGRRPTLLVSLTLGPAALVALGLARSPLLISLAAFVYGVLGDLYRPVNQAILTDVVPPADRARAFGILYWAVNLGVAIATALAGFMAKRSFWLLFAGDAATTLAFAAIVWRWVPETRPDPTEGTREPSLRGLLSPLRDPPFGGFVLLVFCFALVFDQWFAALPLDMRAHGLPTDSYGLVMAFTAVLIVLLQPTATAWLPQLRRSRVLAASAFLLGSGAGLCAFARSATGYAVALSVFTLGEIAQAPVAPAVVADLAPADRRGSYQGLYLMAWSSALVVTPALGAWVLGRFGSLTLWSGCFLLGVFCAAGHLALAPARGRRLAELGGEAAIAVD